MQQIIVKKSNIKQMSQLKPKEALNGLNRLTNLTWREYPSSLIPNGIVIYGNKLKHTNEYTQLLG
jgi:hypothetical protein